MAHDSAVWTTETVAFVDLCGFTTFVNNSSSFLKVLDAFRSSVRQLTRDRAVSVHRWLGDGAMLCAGDPRKLLPPLIRLVRDFSVEQPMALHAGAAAGRVIKHDGDYIGADINLASRLCDEAGNGELIVPAGLLWAISAVGKLDYSEERATVRGFAHPVEVVRLRLGGAADQPGG